MFALLVPSCQQAVNNLVDDIIRLVARLFQQVRYSHDITILLQPCVVNLVTFRSYTTHVKSHNRRQQDVFAKGL